MKEYIPKNIKKTKAKVLGNFTLRQILCIALGTGMFFLITFLLARILPMTLSLVLAIAFSLPVFMVGFVAISGVFLERILFEQIVILLTRSNIRTFYRRRDNLEKN